MHGSRQTENSRDVEGATNWSVQFAPRSYFHIASDCNSDQSEGGVEKGACLTGFDVQSPVCLARSIEVRLSGRGEG